jgi:Protein of unknown function (DUF3592)
MPQRFGFSHAIVGFIIGAFLVALGFSGLRSEILLRKKGIQVDADVTNWRTLAEDLGRTSYEVQYHFSLPGGDETYTRTDSTGRNDLWSSIPKDAWEQSEVSRKLRVVYLPSNPWVNRPAKLRGSISLDLLAVSVLGAVLLLVSAGLIVYLAFTQKRYVTMG